MAQYVSQSTVPNDRNPGSQAIPNIRVKELGFTLLSAGTSPEADIFFIHGLQGHPKNTWTYVDPPRPKENVENIEPKRSLGSKFGRIFKRHSKQPSRSDHVSRTSEMVPSQKKPVFWPSDLLPTDFPNTRIFTYGYDSRVTHWFKGPSMQLDIFSYGESLLNGLESRRREFPNRPLIFIVHSLGGLILKDALRRSRSSNEPRFRAVHLSTKAIFFMGTPHRGGNYVNLGLTARRILVCSGFDANDKILLDLKMDSSTAKLLSEEFSKILDEIRPSIYSFQEATGLSGFGPLSGKVVEDSSSALDYSREIKDVIHANHMNMCRFWGSEDDGYEKVKSALSHCLSRDVVTELQRVEYSFYQRVLSSLYLPDSQERFHQVEEAYEGTFRWIFEKEELGFVNWLQTGNGIFWISGKPASGKSTLLKYVVSHPKTRELLETNNPGNQWICGEFFFTNRGRHTQKTLNSLLQRILYQLLSQCEGLWQFVQKTFKKPGALDRGWLFLCLEEALMNIAKQRKLGINICFFVDALDEHHNNYYEDHLRLVRLVEQLVENSDGKTVKILLCLTSRPETVFQGAFHDYPGFPIHEHTHTDIQTYVHGRMRKCLQSRPDLIGDAQIMASLDNTFKEVVRRAHGVFLWVKLVVTDFIEGLVDGEDPYRLRDILIAIPGDGDLQELYREILLQLRPKYMLEAFLMLHIAFAASEPMPISSFFQALNITIHGNLKYDWFIPSNIEMRRQLTSRCRGFLEVQESFTTDELGNDYQGPVVQFLHQSVKDFLSEQTSFQHILGKLNPKFPLLKGLLSENGYAYLLRFRVHEHLRKYGEQPDIIKQHNKFDLRKFDVLYLAYMSEVTLGKTSHHALNALSEFADVNGLVPFYMSHANWRVPSSWKPTFLVLAVQAGLAIYVESYLKHRVNIRNLSGRPLLHYAVLPMPESLSTRMNDPFIRGSKMIKLLARLGAPLEAQFEGLNALAFLLVQRGHSERHTSDRDRAILQTLLQLGAETDILLPVPQYTGPSDNNSQPAQFVRDNHVTPLQLAIRRDDIELTTLLLQFNAKLSALTDDDWKFLRKGYRYDQPPKFRARPDQTIQEQLERWLKLKQECIQAGQNTKPMLRLIQKYASGNLLPGPTIRRNSSAPQVHFVGESQITTSNQVHGRPPSRKEPFAPGYNVPQDSFGDDWGDSYLHSAQEGNGLNALSSMSDTRIPRMLQPIANTMSTVLGGDSLRRSVSVGYTDEDPESRLFPMATQSPIVVPLYSPGRPEHHELFF